MTRREFVDKGKRQYAEPTRESAASYYLHWNGSMTIRTNNTGAVMDTVANNGYRVLTSDSNPSIADLYKCDGFQSDGAPALEYHWHRYFDAATIFWMGQDSLGFAAGDENLYRYVRNSPLTQSDARGLAPPAPPPDVGALKPPSWPGLFETIADAKRNGPEGAAPGVYKGAGILGWQYSKRGPLRFTTATIGYNMGVDIKYPTGYEQPANTRAMFVQINTITTTVVRVDADGIIQIAKTTETTDYHIDRYNIGPGYSTAYRDTCQGPWFTPADKTGVVLVLEHVTKEVGISEDKTLLSQLPLINRPGLTIKNATPAQVQSYRAGCLPQPWSGPGNATGEYVYLWVDPSIAKGATFQADVLKAIGVGPARSPLNDLLSQYNIKDLGSIKGQILVGIGGNGTMASKIGATFADTAGNVKKGIAGIETNTKP